MVQHVPLVRKRLATRRTLERLFARVTPHVLGQVRLVPELALAVFARKRFLAGVAAEVLVEVVLPREASGAEGTLVRLLASVDTFVHGKLRLVRRGVGAVAALETVPSARLRVSWGAGRN